MKMEPKEDDSEQEIIEAKFVEDYVTEREFVQEAVAKALDEGILYKERHCLPEIVQVCIANAKSQTGLVRLKKDIGLVFLSPFRAGRSAFLGMVRV